MRISLKWALVLGCAACCAPLVLPVLTGIGVAGWLSVDRVLCGLPLLGFGLWPVTRNRRVCDCAESSGAECTP